MTSKKSEKEISKAKKIQNSIENFADLLDSINNLDDHRGILWREIYSNAVEDRERAAILFTNATMTMDNSTVTHTTLGTTLTKYLERMNKSNEQILRLAEMISKIEDSEKSVNASDLYDSME